MKIRIPILVQDPQTTRFKGIKSVEGFDPSLEEFFLDGPVTKRIAILDFDPQSGSLLPGVKFQPPPKGLKRGFYVDADDNDLYDTPEDQIYTPAFMSVSVFATVLKTVYMFERPEILGRDHIEWAFEQPQLMVIPRAGQKENAFYHRDSASLQFFYFPSGMASNRNIYTCLSRDIVAHETGHALIDAIAPDLLDASSPQSLAIHEALADITALLMAFGSHNLADAVLDDLHGSIDSPSAFSSIAEEFGAALGRRYGLRSLINKATLDSKDKENFVPRHEPHILSQVLSGALYNLMITIHEDLKKEYALEEANAAKPDPLFSASGKALRKGAERFQRMIFRGLDFLPPGEVSFADLGRAMLAADQIAYPKDGRMRECLSDEFVKRHVIGSADELLSETSYEHKSMQGIDVKALHNSAWAAYQFANQHRDLLGIPEGIPFEIRPRLHVSKKYDEDLIADECILKVTWTHVEENNIGTSWPSRRRITVGTTLVLDWASGKILARLTNAPRPPASEKSRDKRIVGPSRKAFKQQQSDRDALLKTLIEKDVLAANQHGYDPDNNAMLSRVQADVVDDVMRTYGTAKLLHIIGEN